MASYTLFFLTLIPCSPSYIVPRRLLLSPLLGFLLALPGWAQQPGSYAISGQDPRLAGRHVYLLTPERPSPTRPWPALDSAQADASGHFELQGRVPAPEVYWLRIDKQRVLQPVPLANQHEHLNGSVVLSPSSTRQAPVYFAAPEWLPGSNLATSPPALRAVAEPGGRRF